MNEEQMKRRIKQLEEAANELIVNLIDANEHEYTDVRRLANMLGHDTRGWKVRQS